MVTSNDYGLGLMNGDIGIALKDQNNKLRVAFPAGDKQIHWVSPLRLPNVETAYAMTVHKSQGSEFSHVVLVLPDQFSQVLTRELIYTGITRAKLDFTLVESQLGVLKQAVLASCR
jgi:exodeoxyribonuclease V alpha subunit